MTADNDDGTATVAGPVVRTASVALEHLLAAGVGRTVHFRTSETTATALEEDSMTALHESDTTGDDAPMKTARPAERVLRWAPEAPLYGHLALDDDPNNVDQLPRFEAFVDLSEPLVQGLLSVVEITRTADGWCECRWPVSASESEA